MGTLAKQFKAMQYKAIQSNAMQYKAMQYKAKQSNAMQCKASNSIATRIPLGPRNHDFDRFCTRDPEIRNLRGRFPPSGFVFQELPRRREVLDSGLFAAGLGT